MSHSLDYGAKMHRALRGVIAEVLEQVSRDGLPGDHHFFITFDTTHPDVEMADRLFDRYPKEMTIVIQQWFDALIVGEDGFQITLNFGNSPEPMTVPFEAIQTFVDPSVEFGLRFEQHEEDISEEPAPRFEAHDAEEEETGTKPGDDDSGSVVSLDKFRK